MATISPIVFWSVLFVLRNVLAFRGSSFASALTCPVSALIKHSRFTATRTSLVSLADSDGSPVAGYKFDEMRSVE